MAFEANNVQPYPLPAQSNLAVALPSANAAAVVTLLAPGNNTANVTCHIHFSFSAVPTNSNVTLVITDGLSTWTEYINAGYIGNFEFPFPLIWGTNKPVTITLGAAGSGISGALNVTYKTLFIPTGPPPDGLNYSSGKAATGAQGGAGPGVPIWPPLIYA